MNVLKHLYHKHPEVLLLIIGILVFLLNLDALFVNIMEARNFITAREMLEFDNWIFTTMNEMPRYQKPPLPTWLTAISAAILGEDNSFSYRFPAALASIFLTIMLFKIQLTVNIHKILAFGSSIILATSFYVFFAGREGQWDIFTHSFMAGSIYFLLQLLDPRGNSYSAALWAGLFLGASIMSKGPVSLYALFLPFLISYGLTYKFSRLHKIWKPLLLFIVTGIVTGVWWTIIVTYYDPAEFTRIAEVESDRWFNYNTRPFYYYWSFFTQSGIWTIPALGGLIYWYMKSRVSNLKAYKFFLFWTLFAVLLLSIIPEKKSRYLLPVLIPMAVTTGFYAEYVIRNFKSRMTNTEKFPVYLNFGLLALISFAAPFVLYFLAAETVMKMKYSFFLFSLFLLLWGAGFIFGIMKNNMKFLFSLQAGLIILIISLGFPLLKLIDPSNNNPNVADVRDYATQERLQVYDYANMLPEFIWSYGETIPEIEKNGHPPSDKEFLLLVEEGFHKDWREEFSNFRIEPLGTLDLNPTYATGTNSRLIRKYYRLTRLEP